MVSSQAATPEDYLIELDGQRAAELRVVREAVNAALPVGYVERMAWGMISWEVPLELSGPTYNKQPLVYAALAAQKNYNVLHLNGVYASPARAELLRDAFRNAGKKLDMGKSCLRFRKADDLSLEAIGAEIASMDPKAFVQISTSARDLSTAAQSRS